MAYKRFNVCYSVAEPDKLKIELVKRYVFKNPIDCCVFRCSVNNVYLIKTEDIVYYLRIANNGVRGLSLIDYEEEANIMISLNENGVNTAVPVRCKNGKFVWQINSPEGVRYAILFKEVKNNPSDDSIKRSNCLGKALANIHIISDNKNYKVSRVPIDFTYLIEKPLTLLEPYLKNKKPEEYIFICNSLNKLKKYITERLPAEKPYYGFCHGDVSGNVFFQGETPTFFDFDFMGNGWRLDDISFYIWGMEKQNPQYRESKEYNAFMDGYNAVRRLSDNEMDCINAFCAIRSIWSIGFCIMAFAKRNGLAGIEDHINYCINNFRMRYGQVFDDYLPQQPLQLFHQLSKRIASRVHRLRRTHVYARDF